MFIQNCGKLIIKLHIYEVDVFNILATPLTTVQCWGTCDIWSSGCLTVWVSLPTHRTHLHHLSPRSLAKFVVGRQSFA